MKRLKTNTGHKLSYELFKNETTYVSPKRISLEQRRAFHEVTMELLEENVFKYLPSRRSAK